MEKSNRPRTGEDVLKAVADNDVKFIKLWFTDILGFLKSFTITRDELDRALSEGMGFDGSSIEGFARIDESDMMAQPDPSTFAILPQEKSGYYTGRMFCDILWPGGQPFEGDPRYVLKTNLKRAQDMGCTFYVGPELEYFYFRGTDSPQQVDSGGYFDLTPPDTADDLRQETVMALQQMGINVEFSHHEAAPSQHEIDIRYDDALAMADNIMTYRVIVKQVAQRHGLYATFMPKPLFGQNGNGMHVHMSLFNARGNIFFDPNDKYHLSPLARQFMAGLLKHAPEITSVTSQWVNSYKRLVPGYEAPVYVTWAYRNRSDLIRVPGYRPGKEDATRIEYRSPDPACNPYLTFSVILAAGLEGIERKYELAEPTEENAFTMSAAERQRRGIITLPGSLDDAILLTEKSDLVRKALGAHVFSTFIQNKKIEWDQYRIQVTDYELNRYLSIL